MISRLFSRSALHEHAEPAQRALGVAELPPESDEIGNLLTTDPAVEVRLAAAQRCTDLAILAAAWKSEADASVREALAPALADAIAGTADETSARDLLQSEHTGDAIRAEVVRRAQDAERRRMALAAIQDEDALVALALGAGHAETRLAAAERVHSQVALNRLAEAAKQRDHGVYRLARQRAEAIQSRADQTAEADLIIEQLEALAARPGPVLSEMVELNRRWQALDMSADAARLQRCDAARRSVQERLDREREEQRARARFEVRLREWLQSLQTLVEPDSAALTVLRNELDGLREGAQSRNDGPGLADLAQAHERLAALEAEALALAGAEVLVVEAELLAAGTYIDHGDLPERWQALDRAIRTPSLTRRFESALIAVEQRRLVHTQLALQEASAARQRIHALLHGAEQALAAGQLREARTAADELRKLRVGAGALPKPTMQRLGRLQQQLVELERWQAFGQHNARVQLCERAEAAAAHNTDMRQLAQEIQALRNEWKTLDQQHAGVPKTLWERFDRACEKAYAPAARYFAEQAARRKEARKKREDFIAAASEHARFLLQEPRDWRAIERWLRDIDQQWRDGDLGSIEPRLWKELDARLKGALAPLRAALGEIRDQAKAVRRQLIADTNTLAAKVFDRDTPSQVKAIQARWQEQAKAMPLPQRDERALWDEFRTACDAVFKLRQDKRKEQDERKGEARRALDEICGELEALAQTHDTSDQDVRRSLRELQDRWRARSGGGPDPSLRGVETRFRNAKAAVETMLSARAHSRENAVWQTLAAKERLCETLDELLQAGAASSELEARSTEVSSRWNELPALPATCEKKMTARRDAALRTIGDPAAAGAYLKQMQQAAESRLEGLLELELLLGLDSPAELQSARLAVQVKQLRDRFKNAASTSTESASERLCSWCSQAGVIGARDRARAERVFAAMGRRR